MLRLLESSRRSKQIGLLIGDLIAIPVLVWVALSLRYETWSPPLFGGEVSYLAISLFAIGCFIVTGVYHAMVRAFDEQFLKSLLIGVLGISLGLFGVSAALPGFPQGLPFVIGFLIFLWVWGSRSLIRAWVKVSILRAPVTRVVIYGAGVAGRQLLAALKASMEFVPVAFIDDNPKLVGTIVSGLRVFHGNRVREIIRQLAIKEVLIAMPSASRLRRREVIDHLESLSVRVRLLPGMLQLVNGQVSISDTKEVDIADLLGRDRVSPNQALLERGITGKVVLVTGAGGSIGSELCRQIVVARPFRLILWEMSEFALYDIEQELRIKSGDVDIIPILGSVLYQERLVDVMRRYQVNTVYHAAAYKHVPLVELNPFEGVINNVLGTRRAAEAAIAAGVETFVLISTDKAVRPTNVMGASKRLAELVLQAYAADEASVKTRFCIVRFGNVLGSSGSVAPLFLKQISVGGPVTVTDPEVTRYFMTIPEAAELVIQAGAMGKGGDVFVLDMGEPVKIVDLARKIIHLSGMSIKDADNPEGDIEIRYTGLRLGEKLYEELLIGNNIFSTDHPRIMRAMERSLPLSVVLGVLDEIQGSMCHSQYNVAWLKHMLLEHVDGYVPDNISIACA